MPSLILVMTGGAIGAGARHLVGRALLGWAPGLPLATLAVNLLGGFAMGLLAGSLIRLGASGEPARLLIGVGVLGGFTTFSAFSLEMFAMIERGGWGLALGYALASVAGSVAALALGIGAARALA